MIFAHRLFLEHGVEGGYTEDVALGHAQHTGDFLHGRETEETEILLCHVEGGKGRR